MPVKTTICLINQHSEKKSIEAFAVFKHIQHQELLWKHEDWQTCQKERSRRLHGESLATFEPNSLTYVKRAETQ